MADVDGSYDCVVKSPMGEQKSVLTVKSDGGSWTGTNEGSGGAVEIEDGKVDGNKLTWKMNVKQPMPMTLDGAATVEGDSITGTVTAGPFGSFPMTGSRKA